jgi:hypothetical protein
VASFLEATLFSSDRRRVLILAAVLVTAASFVRAQNPAAEWWAHVVWLSDDALKGRAAGSEGHRKAAEYVAAQFRTTGLTPAAGRSYLQPVPLRAVTVDSEASSVSVVVQNLARPLDLSLKTDVALNPRGTCGAITTGLEFVGYGLHLPEQGYDDLAGTNLTGRIAVYFTGAPSHLTSALVAHRQGTGERWRVMKERGAVGQLAIYNPYQPGADWNRTITTAQQPTYTLDGDELDDRRFAGTVLHEKAEPMFLASGHTLSDLLEKVKAGQPLPRIRLAAELRARLRCTSQPAPSENVVALLEGRDSQLRREVVVLTAHLDHVGQFGSGEDTIYNGAMDNASGVASLIDLAARLRASGYAPRRSIAFVAVTAEERNLLGSYYFARRPPLPGGMRMVANINLDQFLPIIPMKSIIAFGMEESSLRGEVEAAAAAVGIPAERDPIPAQNVFIRSDQYNFVRAGIPAVMLLTGANGDKAIWKTWEDWMATRYHRPNDDVSQPVNFESAATFQRLLMALVRRVADADEAPRWNADSVFRPRS